MVTTPVRSRNYDFAFEEHFACRERTPHTAAPVEAVARVGAPADYGALYHRLLADGIRLVHTPETHRRSSELPAWYPLLDGLTPRSIWFDEPPTAAQVLALFEWPVFMKGARRTGQHRRALSIIEGPEALAAALRRYAVEPLLQGQQIVCREYVPLRPIPASYFGIVPCAYEFRTFWWRGHLAGHGPYWHQAAPYAWTAPEAEQALTLAREAARRLDVPFLVVDVAQTQRGDWIVIECNDGQESGYAGVPPRALWRRILSLEREHGTRP